MTEHLFKLKKNGRIVGYCKWTKDLGFIYSLTPDFEKPFTHFAVAQTEDISAHPFVTKDKNSRNVFADDMVSFLAPNSDYKKTSLVEWTDCGAVVAADIDYFPYLGECSDIELIEEKNNE